MTDFPQLEAHASITYVGKWFASHQVK